MKIYHRGQLIKTHPTAKPGTRRTDVQDLPAEKSAYALPDITKPIYTCAHAGENVGIYAERILDDPLPWTRMRTAYRIIGLVRQYGPDAVDAACSRALKLDVIAVGKIASMLTKATENLTFLVPQVAPGASAHFARDPSGYATLRPGTRPGTAPGIGVQLTLIDGNNNTPREKP